MSLANETTQTCARGTLQFRGTMFFALVLSLLVGCEEPTVQETLSSQGIAVSPESLLEATVQNQAHLITLLTAAGVNPDQIADESGRTPLMLAAGSGFPDAATRLLEHSLDLDRGDQNGMTALAHAIRHGHLDIAEQLLEAGASPDTDGKQGEALLASAVMHSQIGAVELLLEHGARAGLDDALLIAVTERKLRLVEVLLNAGADPDAGADFLMPALNIALQNGDTEGVERLLDSGATANHMDDDSMRALGYALLEGDTALLSTLLAKGADPDLPCERGLTPMEISVEQGDAEALGLLLVEGGAAIHPLLVSTAIDRGNPEVLATLLDHGAGVDTPDRNGETLLTRAVRAGDQDQIKLLLARGANPDSRCIEGQSLLTLAVALQQPETVVALIENGADPNENLLQPISEAFHELVDSRTFSFYAKRDSRFTPIMVSAAQGHGDTLRALMRNGASTNRYTKGYKRYPISFASEAGHIEAQQLIVGYDPLDRSETFKIVIDLSSQRAVMYKNGSPHLSSQVSTGKSGYRTPTGDFVVTNKHRTWTSTLYDSPMPYFMRLSGQAFGTHVGYVPNYPASHGCIRMPHAKAKAFFNAAPRGTLVSIVN